MLLRPACIPLSVVLAFSLGLDQARADVGDSNWRYVVPQVDEDGPTPVVVVVPLAAERPEAIKTEPPARGDKRSYALLRYGSPSSPLLPIVLDEQSGGQFVLTIDFSRSGEMGDSTPVEGSGRTRKLEIKSAITHKDRAADEYPRQVLIRQSASGKSLSVAMLGYLSGSVKLGDKAVSARRVDGNANGLFADPQDRLWAVGGPGAGQPRAFQACCAEETR